MAVATSAEPETKTNAKNRKIGSKQIAEFTEITGGAGEIRTPDLWFRKTPHLFDAF
jgi:hypothetical protein